MVVFGLERSSQDKRHEPCSSLYLFHRAFRQRRSVSLSQWNFFCSSSSVFIMVGFDFLPLCRGIERDAMPSSFVLVILSFVNVSLMVWYGCPLSQVTWRDNRAVAQGRKVLVTWRWVGGCGYWPDEVTLVTRKPYLGPWRHGWLHPATLSLPNVRHFDRFKVR